MFELKYIEKSAEAPNGKVLGKVYEEASWLYNEKIRYYAYGYQTT